MVPACSRITGFRESDSLGEGHIPFFTPSPHVRDNSTTRKKEWLHRDSSARTETIFFQLVIEIKPTSRNKVQTAAAASMHLAAFSMRTA